MKILEFIGLWLYVYINILIPYFAMIFLFNSADNIFLYENDVLFNLFLISIPLSSYAFLIKDNKNKISWFNILIPIIFFIIGYLMNA